jgi:hypothetical protein
MTRKRTGDRRLAQQPTPAPPIVNARAQSPAQPYDFASQTLMATILAKLYSLRF